jgi:alpha-tubulin suppressor-like RCC1 family protein
MAFNGTGSNVTSLNASNISSGTVATGRLASGTANSTTFLRGDQIWSTLPASGGLTNNVRQAVTSSATTTININSGNVVDLTMASNITTLAFSNVPASGTPLQLVIVFRNDAVGTNYQVTWPASIYWNSVGGAANSLVGPSLITGANSLTIVSLLTTDGGTKWRGWVESTIYGGLGYGIWAWGGGALGQLGQNSITNRSSPVQIGATTSWTEIKGSGAFKIALSTSGTLFGWGSNSVGQLAQNNTTNRSSPVQIGANTNWAAISVGSNHVLALTSDGKLYAWGNNSDGQLGNGVSGGGYVGPTSTSSPIQVSGSQTWAKISAGTKSSSAITTTGQLWTWGYNGYGVLGKGNASTGAPDFVPAQVGALTTWASITMTTNHALAVTTSGTLFSWGRNFNGALGQNDRVNRSSPVQVGANTNWALTSGSDNNSSFAITTTGQLWSWGNGYAGNTGHGDTIARSSPTQVGALTTWAKLPASVFDSSTGVITTSGTLFSWGLNNLGQLGQDDRISRSSPVQVGTDTNWVLINAGYSAAALRGPASTINPA